MLEATLRSLRSLRFPRYSPRTVSGSVNAVWVIKSCSGWESCSVSFGTLVSAHRVSRRGGPDTALLAEDGGLGDLAGREELVVDVSCCPQEGGGGVRGGGTWWATWRCDSRSQQQQTGPEAMGETWSDGCVASMDVGAERGPGCRRVHGSHKRIRAVVHSRWEWSRNRNVRRDEQSREDPASALIHSPSPCVRCASRSSGRLARTVTQCQQPKLGNGGGRRRVRPLPFLLLLSRAGSSTAQYSPCQDIVKFDCSDEAVEVETKMLAQSG